MNVTEHRRSHGVHIFGEAHHERYVRQSDIVMTSLSRTRRTNKLLIVPLIATSMAVLTACGGPSSEAGSPGTEHGNNATRPNMRVGYFTGGEVAPENLVDLNPTSKKSIDANIKMIPITAGLAALSEMRGGAFDIVSSVGNPPVVSAIAANTPLRVVWVESFDGAELITRPDIHSTSDLAGKKIADLTGSSEDFELRGWLKHEGLYGKAKVVGFSSDAAAGAAWKAGKVAAAYVMFDVGDGLMKKGGHKVATASGIAKLGYPSLNVTAASESFIKDHPTQIQQYVCAEMNAQKLLATGPKAKRNKAIKASAKQVGASPKLALSSTLEWPILPVDQVSHWLGGKASVTTDAPIIKAYVLTSNFLKGLGSLPQTPSTSDLIKAVDPSFALKALSGKCS